MDGLGRKVVGCVAVIVSVFGFCGWVQFSLYGRMSGLMMAGVAVKGAGGRPFSGFGVGGGVYFYFPELVGSRLPSVAFGCWRFRGYLD